MAEVQTHTAENGQVTAASAQKSAKNTTQNQRRGPSIHQIYSLPAPIRTFPLPVLYPSNPVSLFTVAYAWLRQVLNPPAAEPAVIHQGVWDVATGSVHVNAAISVRGLWEQGFYGKGSLSRSEPNWLKRELVRKGRQETHVSEILTSKRREERAQAKWERARLEQEAIRQTRLEEARLAASATQSTLTTLLPPPPPAAMDAPVGPLELLRLPNSERDRVARSMAGGIDDGSVGFSSAQSMLTTLIPPAPAAMDAPVGPFELLCLPNSEVDRVARSMAEGTNDGRVLSVTDDSAGQQLTSENRSCCGSGQEKLKQRKSVRFSPKVESTTFNLIDPPSPRYSVNGRAKQPLSDEDVDGLVSPDVSVGASLLVQKDGDGDGSESEDEIVNMEHLQLTPEESFFLTFGLGVLSVTDGETGSVLSNKDMLTLFRQFSHFPPRMGSEAGELGPDDDFLVHYAVYHHFRSLGWVPRAGIKFGVDWLLYTRGPVFDHAEFGLIVIPSYSDAWWKARGAKGPTKTWHWLHGVVRVLSHVIKSLVLVYVDVPPPPVFDAAMETGYAEALKLYRVREVMVKRWSSNRNR
ncbi:hypothetical protein E4U41_007809 [Claviceps citrina]|nr:hypothetical protein E4U41_007809 [Claviceps citrina]